MRLRNTGRPVNIGESGKYLFMKFSEKKKSPEKCYLGKEAFPNFEILPSDIETLSILLNPNHHMYSAV